MDPTKMGKGTKLLAVVDAAGLPLTVHATSDSQTEVPFQATLEQSFVAQKPERLIGDKAYGSDPLNAALAEKGLEMIAPHRCWRKKAKIQDGWVLRRYRRRWKVERLFAWL